MLAYGSKIVLDKDGDIIYNNITEANKERRMKMALETKTCNRCGGSGHYSYHMMHGTVCFKCDGKGIILASPSKKGVKVNSSFDYCDVGDVIKVSGVGVAKIVEIEIGEFERKEPGPFGAMVVTYPQRIIIESLIDGKKYKMYRRLKHSLERVDSNGVTWIVNPVTNVWSVKK